ncbi:LppP/LprE family lipoprotein [Nocardia australiensis]|uniref:LppP/LprE family lipoprotein n=1 Tax=Nocardia australiensis TaxID=2887191 RepID=UPI001D1515BD|nr:LppP/LprE family lipoprotein [Nocardia australiensis]
MNSPRPALSVALAGLALAGSACGSTTEVVGPTITVSPPANIILPATPPSASAASTAVSARLCGVDLNSPVIQSAVATLPMEESTRSLWSTDPRTFVGNFDPCVTLTTVIVTIDGATAESTNQALLFHQSAYIGAATRENYRFITLDREHTNDDTVGLSYRSSPSCDTCTDGNFTDVRFHWDGSRVQMIGGLTN